MRLKGSTMVESLVAITLISVAFGISVLIFLNTSRTGNLREKLTTHQVIQEMAVKIKSQSEWVDQIVELDGIQYSCYFEKMGERGLTKLAIKAASEDGRLIEEYREYLLRDEAN